MQLEVLINMANFNQGSTELGYIGNILQSGGNWGCFNCNVTIF